MERTGHMFVSPAIAAKLLDGWVKHFSTCYHIIHTPGLWELHAKRDDPLNLDVFGRNILHLVYVNSGKVLETMSNEHPTAQN
jgi:hypothetical protein